MRAQQQWDCYTLDNFLSNWECLRDNWRGITIALEFQDRSRVRWRWRAESGIAETVPRSGCWCNEHVFSGCLVQQYPDYWWGRCAGDGAKTREVRKRAHLTFALQLCPLPHRSSLIDPCQCHMIKQLEVSSTAF